MTSTDNTSKPLKTVEKCIENIWCGALDAKTMEREFQAVSDYEAAYIKYKTNVRKQAKADLYQLMLSLVRDVKEEVRKDNYMPLRSPYGAVDTMSQALEAKLSEHFNVEGEV